MIRADNERYEIADFFLGGLIFSRTILHPYKSTKGHSHSNKEIYYFPHSGGLIHLGELTIPIDSNMVIEIKQDEFHRVENLTDKDFTFVCAWEKEKNNGESKCNQKCQGNKSSGSSDCVSC